MNYGSPVTALKGIGEKTAKKFEAAGIPTLETLLQYYPRTYDMLEEISEENDLTDGQKVAVCGFIEKQLSVRYVGRFQIVTGTIKRKNSRLPVTWFNMPYLRSQISPGTLYVFRGICRQKGRMITLQQPKIYSPSEYESKRAHLQPVYTLSSGLSETILKKAIAGALPVTRMQEDHLPDRIRDQYNLFSYADAIEQIHFPTDFDTCIKARRRLVFDEFLMFILGMKRMSDNMPEIMAGTVLKKTMLCNTVIHSLPFQLTDAQMLVWQQVEQDMTQNRAMSRLIQGDVGSGKTIIAFLALIMAADNGAQGALMVPTEVLARQHFEAFLEFLEDHNLPYTPVLLTGSLTAAKKREAYEKIASGEASVIIGTHALIQEKVAYRNLAIAITDEQHRFGVKQRETLQVKGKMPHILVMSATPIPRTLAVILYGDLDISVIDQLPEGRLPIKNCVVDKGWRPKAYSFIENQARLGHQAYVICPMVEESEEIDGENVSEYARQLREVLPPSVTVDILHGQMKQTQKNEVMDRFVRGDTKVLVSTTVIEVGVNVPNATVMMIEDAQRFGLAQLHQLRGRVGRGKDQSYCIMIDTSRNAGKNERLEIMNQSNDGFEIARKDLELRGPGDFFGIRQSGIMDFKIADVFQDASVMQMANDAAEQILRENLNLSTDTYQLLFSKLKRYMGDNQKGINL